MVIRTIFTCVIRFFLSVRSAFLSVSTPSRATTGDVESGVSKISGVADVEIGPTFARVEPNRKISTLRPVKSRIVDAVLRNVRDKRSSVLREVVITRGSLLHLPYSAKVEVFPRPTPSSRASISTALKVLKTSGERVVKFVLTPTFLLDTDPVPRASRPPARSDHSIRDIIALFPSPPVHVSAERLGPNEVDFESNLRLSTKEYRSSLSTSGSVLSLTSVETSATSPPTTPELDQMTRMVSGIGIVVERSKSRRCRPSLIGTLESVESASAVSLQTNRSRKQTTLDQSCAYVPSCCTQAVPTSVPVLLPWHNGLNSATQSDHLLQEGDIFPGTAPDDLTSSVTQNGLSSDTTSKGQARDPETSLMAITQADSEPMRKDPSSHSIEHVLHTFRDANGEDRLKDVLYQESYYPGNSRFSVLQCFVDSTPSSSTDRVRFAPSCSEGLATPDSIQGTSDMSPSPPFLCVHDSLSGLGPNIIIHGPRRDQDYGNTIESVDAQTRSIGSNSPLMI